MSGFDRHLEARARRAYELSRLAVASRRALLLVPLMALSLAGCAGRLEVLGCGALLLGTVTLLLWRGQDYGAAVMPGLIAGLTPLVLPPLAQLFGRGCAYGSCQILPSACALGGLAGGILLGILAPRPHAGRLTPFVATCSVATLAGAVGCLLYGLVGLAFMAAGLAMGALPLLAARRA